MLAKRRAIIISVVIASVLVILAAALAVVIFFAEPVVTLDCKTEKIEVFSSYEKAEVDAEVKILGIPFSLDTATAGEVDTAKLGTYTIEHTAEFFGNRACATQTVEVVDTTAPTIKVEEENVRVEFVGYPIKPEQISVKYSAEDNYDGDITAEVKKVVNEGECYLSVTDSSGNETIREINLIIDDGIRPTLVLSGPTTVYVAAGGKFSDPGYSATDNLDGNITDKVEVIGEIDFNRSGEYPVTYKVTDSSGNSVKLTRKIVIYGSENSESFSGVTPNGKTVYLTFDDGPGAYTERLLGYLKKYDVKATFFVTNQFPKYQGLIKSAYLDGHKIAIHTYSHQIYSKKNNIYSSVDAFMKDFNSIQSVVEKQTGHPTNIFRFPGGTNNTISKGYCKGIMTELSKQLTDAGYFYFDWNVDSYDSRSSSNTQKIITETISQIKNKTNAVVLMHDIHKKTVEAVPAVIEYCLRNGYTFKVLDESSPAVRYKPQN